MNRKLPSVTVITVNYNNAKGLMKTIESVLSQSYEALEFIVVDGGSTDESLDILDSYKNNIDIVISESDNGIYDAMNKGIAVSSGRWLNFMNSGDVFYNNNVIKNIFYRKIPSNIKLIYGEQYNNGAIISPLPTKFLELGIIHACHQAMFFVSDIKYSLEYSIYSDYDLVARIYKKEPKHLLYLNEIICEFEGGGISSFVSREKRWDKYKSVFKNFGLRHVFASVLYMLSNKLVRK
ncbi:glycosyltransferase family 2 protein [Vibrio fluvialis]|uniref:glycosyltransferase family 2 protein n=1 Tax=Vibrio fluvialis TaxID=676 RepID=UPI0028F6C403|nr:glycosyltransferase family 2 protein [Vibrio fluvialis]